MWRIRKKQRRRFESVAKQVEGSGREQLLLVSTHVEDNLGYNRNSYGIKKMRPIAAPLAERPPSALQRVQQLRCQGGQLPGR